MSCLTRKMQQKLTKYVQKNAVHFRSDDPDYIRKELVSKGVCPSAVTTDQVTVIINEASRSA
ncbi:hypothetical protein [Paraglaciecola sp. 2405UD69-4]|uniref:hypothetical protein n=1 Tax=Paraglaciecola sp. 2405UD69-4 TaxID=3391836 RepID=UPI0039C99257